MFLPDSSSMHISNRFFFPFQFNIFTHRPNREETIVRNFQVQPKDYLIHAILVTIFCSLPCGIIAIIKAMKVKQLTKVELGLIVYSINNLKEK